MRDLVSAGKFDILASMSDDPDLTLLAHWRAGDNSAGRELFRRYFPAVRRYFINKVSDEHERDDLVQATFERLLKAIPNYRQEASLKTFVLTVAHHVCVDRFRRIRRQREYVRSDQEAGSDSVAVLEKSPFSRIVDGQQARLLLTALRSLPLEAQELLELFYWEDLTGPQIAEVLDIPEGTVRSRLNSARARLERGMERLACSSEELASTLSNLEGWARAIRAQMGRESQVDEADREGPR